MSEIRLPILVVTVQKDGDGKLFIDPPTLVVHQMSRILVVVDPDIGFKFDKSDKWFQPDDPNHQLINKRRVDDLVGEVTDKCERPGRIPYEVSVLPTTGSIDAEAILIVDPIIKNEPKSGDPRDA